LAFSNMNLGSAVPALVLASALPAVPVGLAVDVPAVAAASAAGFKQPETVSLDSVLPACGVAGGDGDCGAAEGGPCGVDGVCDAGVFCAAKIVALLNARAANVPDQIALFMRPPMTRSRLQP
jgi:hypothetical protein